MSDFLISGSMVKTVAIACLALLLAAPARAAGLLDAPLSFTATRTVTIDGRSYTGTLFHAPGYERDEQMLGVMETVFILDGRKGEGFFLVPSVKTYVDFAFPPLLSALAEARLENSPLATEVIDHVPTTKYRIADREPDGTRGEGFAWISNRGVLMKLQGTVTLPDGQTTKIAMQLSRLKEEPLPGALFAPPPDMKELPLAALQPLIGAVLH